MGFPLEPESEAMLPFSSSEMLSNSSAIRRKHGMKVSLPGESSAALFQKNQLALPLQT
jgi:hypothetical protein